MVPMHGVGGRQDLPLPFGVLLAGAAVAVVASFVVLALAWRSARHPGPDAGLVLPRLTAVVDAVPLRWVVRGLGLAVAGWAGLALLAGPDELTNPIFGFLYVWVWVGLVPVSLLLGAVWPTLNPLRTLHLLGCRFLQRDPGEGMYRLPGRVGIWPAAVGLFAFVYLELVAPERATIPVVLLFVAVYVVALLLGSVLFGQRWFAAADPFEAYATLMSHLSPWGRGRDRLLRLRSPLTNLDGFVAGPGTVAFVAVLLGSTAYDGFSNSTLWVSWVQQQDLPTVLTATLMLVGMIAVVVLSYRGAVWAAGRLSGSPLAADPGLFIQSLLPIALGYVVAHYLTLLVFEGQRTAILWSDPLNRGWDVFGTAGRAVDYTLADYPGTIGVVQAGAVVAGHVLGIIVAHDRAIAVSAPARAVRGQLPMLAVMVGYTLVGLLLLFSQ